LRFKDEKPMWHADTERLSRKLENKSSADIQTILDEYDVIYLRSCERPKTTLFNRIILCMCAPIFVFLSSAKWMLTGDRFLDSWCKNSKILSCLFKLSGINQ
jgi:hypothetical protein